MFRTCDSQETKCPTEDKFGIPETIKDYFKRWEWFIEDIPSFEECANAIWDRVYVSLGQSDHETL